MRFTSISCLALTLCLTAGCPTPTNPPPTECVMGPLTVEVPEVADDAVYFGLQGGNHVYALASARGLDEGGQLSVVLSDTETSTMLGRLTYGIGRLVQDPADPCRLSIPNEELRFSSGLVPDYRRATLRVIATRSTGESVSETSETCLVPWGGDPAPCDAQRARLVLTQDERELADGDVLYIESDAGRWTAQVEVTADPPFAGRIEVNLGATSETFPGTFEDGVATAQVAFFEPMYPLTLRVISYVDDLIVGNLERSVRPIPSCVDPSAEDPCVTYWEAFFVGEADARIVDGATGPASLFEAAELWVDERGVLEGDVERVLACDEGAPMSIPLTLAETPLDYLSAGAALPVEVGPHMCEIRLVQEGRTITQQTLAYEVFAD